MRPPIYDLSTFAADRLCREQPRETLDCDEILRLARSHMGLFAVEEGAIGGFGGHVARLLAEEGLYDSGL